MNLRHAAPQVGLLRLARGGAERAEHAAIAREGLEPFATALAVIEELAGIGRHRLDSLKGAFGTSECGLKLHIRSRRWPLRPVVFRRIVRFQLQCETGDRTGPGGKGTKNRCRTRRHDSSETGD